MPASSHATAAAAAAATDATRVDLPSGGDPAAAVADGHGRLASLTEGAAAGSTVTKRLLGTRYTAHALFHRQSAASAAAVESGSEHATSSSTSSYESTAAAASFPSASTSSHEQHAYSGGVAAPHPPLQYQQLQQQHLAWSSTSSAHPYPQLGPAATFSSAYNPHVASSSQVQLPTNLDAMHMERAARRNLGLELFDGVGGGRGSEGGGGGAGYDAALASAAFGTAAGANANIIEISGAALRGNWVPPVTHPGGGSAAPRSTHVVSKVWNPEVGAAVSTKGPTMAQKRKNQINSLATASVALTAKAAHAGPQQFKRDGHQASKSEWCERVLR